MGVTREEMLREANRLYWDTDMSVGRIAERLGWSRRALYEAIVPAPAGHDCAGCATATTFANRSARELGQAVCPGCGEAAELQPAKAAQAGPAPPSAELSNGNADADSALAAPAAAGSPQITLLHGRWRRGLAAGLVLGLTIGVVAIVVNRRA